MTERRIRISYDVVTPESAAIGDFAETGWEDEEGELIQPDAYDLEEGLTAVDLAVKFIRNRVGSVEPSDSPQCHPGRTWYTEIDPQRDYSDGSEKREAFHLVGFRPDEEREIYQRLK